MGRALPLLRVIEGQHAELVVLLRLVQEGGKEQPRRLFPFMRRELLAHLRAAAQELYPMVAEAEQQPETVDVITETNKRIEGLLDQFGTLQYGSPGWNRNIDELVSRFDEHVRLAAGGVFPKSRAMFGMAQLRGMERRFVSRWANERIALEAQQPMRGRSQ